MKRSIYFLLVSQIIMWILFTLSDYIDEVKNNGTYMMACMYFPVIISIVYLLMEKFLNENLKMSKLKYYLLISVIWIVTNVVVSYTIVILASDDHWFVYQHRDGWENFLNSVEYIVMAFWAIAIPTVIIVVSKLICHIVNKTLDIRSRIKDDEKSK